MRIVDQVTCDQQETMGLPSLQIGVSNPVDVSSSKKNGAKTLVFGSFFDHLNHLHQSLVQMDVPPPKRMPLVLANSYGVWDYIKHPVLWSRSV